MKFFLLATLLTAFIFSSLSPGYGQIRTEDDSINQTDTRPVIILTGKLHETTFDYQVPVSWGPVSRLVFYNNYSYYDKSNDNYADTQMNVLGTMITAESVYTYIHFASGINHPWLGPDFTNGLAEGSPDAEWHSRFNINIGYYF